MVYFVIMLYHILLQVKLYLILIKKKKKKKKELKSVS